jgi:hypothetical protein
MLKRLFVVMALGLTACASSPTDVIQPASQPGERPGSGVGGEDVDFNAPPFRGNGVRVDSSDAAAAVVDFTLYVPDPATLPSDLGQAAIYVFPGGAPVPGAFFVYDSATYGPVWLGESLPDIPDADQRMAWYKTAASPENLGAGAEGEVLTIRDGVKALLRRGADGYSEMEWVQNHTQFVLLGPSMSRQQIVGIANSV